MKSLKYVLKLPIFMFGSFFGSKEHSNLTLTSSSQMTSLICVVKVGPLKWSVTSMSSGSAAFLASIACMASNAVGFWDFSAFQGCSDHDKEQWLSRKQILFCPFFHTNKTYSDYSKIRYFCPKISAYTLSENYQKISKREVVRFFGRFSVCFCLCFRGKQSTCVNYQIKIQENLPWRKDEFLDKNGVLEQCDCIWSHPNAVRWKLSVWCLPSTLIEVVETASPRALMALQV